MRGIIIIINTLGRVRERGHRQLLFPPTSNGAGSHDRRTAYNYKRIDMPVSLLTQAAFIYDGKQRKLSKERKWPCLDVDKDECVQENASLQARLI